MCTKITLSVQSSNSFAQKLQNLLHFGMAQQKLFTKICYCHELVLTLPKNY